MKKVIFALAILFFLVYAAFTQDLGNKTRSLSLEDAINLALKQNIEIQIEMSNPEINKWSLRANMSIFSPTFQTSYQNQKQKSASLSYFEGDEPEKKILTYNAGLSQKIPLGGTFGVSLGSSDTTSTDPLAKFNPGYSSALTFSYNQPLLKNFGTLATKKTIYAARLNQQKSLLQLKQKVIDVIYSVEDAYWKLVYAYENYEVQKKSLDLAKDSLRQKEVEVKIGVSAQMDILNAKAEVASRESQLLQAQQSINTAQENLKLILNLSQSDELLHPMDKPTYETQSYQFDSLLKTAMEKRPDIQQARLDLKNRNLDLRYTRNQLLPDLQLQSSYSTSGLSGDSWKVDPYDLTKPKELIGSTKQGTSIRDAFSNKFPNYSVYFRLNYPIINDSARASYATAKLAIRQQDLLIQNTENQIYSAVKQTIMNLESQIKIVEASKIARELAEQKLIAEQKKLSVGLTTDYQVFLIQRDLSTAQSAELNALINYNLAISSLSKVLGTTLEKHKFDINGLKEE